VIKEELQEWRHQPIPEQGRWLGQVVRGMFAYHAVPTDSKALHAIHYHVKVLWLRTLRRRGQKDQFAWERMQRLAFDVDLGVPKIRLRSKPGTAEFLAQYRAALEGDEKRLEGAVRAHTYRWLMIKYLASEEFHNLDARSGCAKTSLRRRVSNRYHQERRRPLRSFHSRGSVRRQSVSCGTVKPICPKPPTAESKQSVACSRGRWKQTLWRSILPATLRTNAARRKASQLD